MLLLGPVLERLQGELFQPLIERVYGIAGRLGMIPEPPPEVEGRELKIEFLSILALAQKQAGLNAIQSFMGVVGELAKADPTVLDKVNADGIVDEVAGINGVPPKLIRAAEEVEALRGQRAQRQQMREGLGAAKLGADVAATGARAVKDAGAGLPPEALAALSGAMGGGDAAVQ
jgi:hypothetical protein